MGKTLAAPGPADSCKSRRNRAGERGKPLKACEKPEKRGQNNRRNNRDENRERAEKAGSRTGRGGTNKHLTTQVVAKIGVHFSHRLVSLPAVQQCSACRQQSRCRRRMLKTASVMRSKKPGAVSAWASCAVFQDDVFYASRVTWSREISYCLRVRQLARVLPDIPCCHITKSDPPSEGR
jgi:hypothetical protein